MNPTQPDFPPPSAAPEGVLDQALALVEFLRTRCPWDARQTPRSLQPSLLEEAYEVVEAIGRDDDPALCGELGDLLLNLAFQVVLAEERGAFGRAEVVDALSQKMRRRHPHLYGDGPEEPWDVVKAREAGTERGGVLDGIPAGTDPLLRAHRVGARAATVGFDWPDALGAWEKVREEVAEVGTELHGGDADALEAELGDLLLAVVHLARLAGTHATSALARANAKFERRFGALEARAAAESVRLAAATPAELDALWNQVKRAERDAPAEPR